MLRWQNLKEWTYIDDCQILDKYSILFILNV